MYWKRLKTFFRKIITRPRPEISFIIPFSSKNEVRIKNLKWLIKHLKYEFPKAEIIVGKSENKVFRKGVAFNDAIKKSRGRVIVLLDADALVPRETIEHCVKRILEELGYGNRLWYVPYRRLVRLSEEITQNIVNSNPRKSIILPDPIPKEWIENCGEALTYGHHYGALCMIIPREAYEAIGCFDERFEGWGGEDVSYLKTFDALWGKFKSTNTPIYHLYHPSIGVDYKDKRWDGQEKEMANAHLANRYLNATGDYQKIKILNDEARKYKEDSQE